MEEKTVIEWKNRIIGSGEEDPAQLLANPFNFRIHTKVQQAALTGSLDTIGWIQQIIVNKRNGHVIDGHLRVSLALRKGEKKVPVLYVDLTDEEEALALMTLDPIAAMAGTDKDKLAEVMRQVNTDNEDLLTFLDELAEREGINKDYDHPTAPECEISPELFERQDYLVFYFENQFDWQVACEKFGVHTVETGKCGDKTLVQRGLGRVLDGKLLLD